MRFLFALLLMGCTSHIHKAVKPAPPLPPAETTWQCQVGATIFRFKAKNPEPTQVFMDGKWIYITCYSFAF